MKMLFRKLLTLALVLAITLSVSGCALTQGVVREAKGRYKTISDNSPDGFHMGPEPQPAYYTFLVVTIPVDIATFPIQLPFWFCIAVHYADNM
jgi:hypothetical protein